MELKFRVSSGQSIYIIDVQGDLDVFSCVELKSKIDMFFKKGVKRLIVNLDKVPYIDSRGIGILIYGHTLFKKAKRHFYLIKVKGSVKKVIELTKLIGYLKIASDEKDALKLMK